MIVLVLSDLHLGKGSFLKNGQSNILEDFSEDETFVEFLEYYSTGDYYWKNVHLVLNGDILNSIQIDVHGVFTHIIDEEVTIRAIDKIVAGHQSFFTGLKSFLQSPNKKITYIIGNHDANLAFEKAQERFKFHVSDKVEFHFQVDLNGIHIEHGHRFEAINTVPRKNYFVDGPNGKKIINLPWGSLFCLFVIPSIKKERPLFDKVRPLPSYIKWIIFHDFPFFLRVARRVISYLVASSFDIYTKQNRNFRTTLKVLKQVTIYPRFEKMAKRILKKNPEIHTVVMGHTHLVEWRRFPQGKFYFNSGTWNTIPSIDAGLHENTQKFNYVLIDVHTKTNTVRDASLNIWQGNWKPYKEEFSLNK